MNARGLVQGVECPACGGAGGGPFGPPGSAWDLESYECPRCQGLGVVRETMAAARPLAKAAGSATATLAPASDQAKRRSTA